MSAPKGATRHAMPWTTWELNQLHLLWGLHSLSTIARRLGRTEHGVFIRVRKLELGIGCPQGFESLVAAADRAGYAVNQLRRILFWARVPVRSYASLPGAHGRKRYVEPIAVDRAVAKWCRCETMREAALRIGMSRPHLGRLYQEDIKAGLIPPPLSRSLRAHHRLDPDVVDGIVARRRGELGRHAARRVGVSWKTLRQWLEDAGVARRHSKLWLVAPEDVDRIVAEKRVTAARAWDPKYRPRVRRGRPLSDAAAQPADESSPQLKLAV